MKSTSKHFIKHVVPAVLRPIRILWNEIIGFVFLVIGGMVAFSTYRNFSAADADSGGPMALVAGGLFAVLLLYFGVSSFLRARRISRT